MTPSTPVCYADDLASCSTSKHKLDQAIDVVSAHGHTWRYNFNAKKSGIFVYGYVKVVERDSYDHVRIRATIYDTTGLEERISKAIGVPLMPSLA